MIIKLLFINKIPFFDGYERQEKGALGLQTKGSQVLFGQRHILRLQDPPWSRPRRVKK